MVTRIERLFLVLIIFLGLFVVQSSRTYAGNLTISDPKGQRAVWSFYKNMRDIQAIQKRAPQALKHLYNPMIDMTKREIRRICKSSVYISTGNESTICDKGRAGVVCRDVGGKNLCKGEVAKYCNKKSKYCWPAKYK